MNEFDLQAWERELKAWRRRVESSGLYSLGPALEHAAAEIACARRDGDERHRARVERSFASLREAYDRLGGSASLTMPA